MIQEEKRGEGLVLLGGDELAVVDGNTLGRVARLVDADQTVRELKHVRPQRDDDELSRLRPFANVVGDDADVSEVECWGVERKVGMSARACLTDRGQAATHQHRSRP